MKTARLSGPLKPPPSKENVFELRDKLHDRDKQEDNVMSLTVTSLSSRGHESPSVIYMLLFLSQNAIG